MQEAAELVRLVEEAKQEAASGDNDRSGLKELIKKIAEREVVCRQSVSQSVGQVYLCVVFRRRIPCIPCMQLRGLR